MYASVIEFHPGRLKGGLQEMSNGIFLIGVTNVCHTYLATDMKAFSTFCAVLALVSMKDTP